MAKHVDTFLYDDTTSVVTSAVRWIKDRSDGTVKFEPASPDSFRALSLSPEDMDLGAVLVTAKGERFLGAEAFGEILRRNDKYDRNLAGRLILEQPSKTIVKFVYGLAAKNRYRWSSDASRPRSA